ncbi:MAG: hypothetical protein ACYYK0_03925 [Candidatus Eutrophobiaceae bacterium]
MSLWWKCEKQSNRLMMTKMTKLFFSKLSRFLLCIALPIQITVAGEVDSEKKTLPSYLQDVPKEELPSKEIERHIGRMGEIEEIPEDFEFSEAENTLWLSNHLSNIKEPMQLYYEFVKDGSYEDGFSDSVYLDIHKLNEDGTKIAKMQFFTGERKQNHNPDNVNNIVGNPVLGIFMQGDTYEMMRLTDGSWRHFHKRIKIALRENFKVEDIDIEFMGKKVKGRKIVFFPYENDPHRSRFAQFAEKSYEFIFSDQVPGSLYQISTIIHDPDKSKEAPLMREILTLVNAKPLQSP